MAAEGDKGYSLGLISKHRNALFGVAILWIMLLHGRFTGNIYFGFLGKNNVINKFILFGAIGADIFLFLSGIGLYFSFMKNREIVPFFKRRLIRVLPAVFLIFGIDEVYYLMVGKISIKSFLASVSLLRYYITGDTYIWFINVILLFYLFYPYIFHFPFDRGNSLVRVLILVVGSFVLIGFLQYVYPSFFNPRLIGFTRMPIMLFGCWFGKLVYEQRKMNKKWLIVFAMSAFGIFVIWGYTAFGTTMWGRTLLGFTAVSFTVTLAYVFELLSREKLAAGLLKFFGFLGAVSLELYLAHWIVLNHYRRTFSLNEGGHGRLSIYFLCPLLSVLISVAVRFVCKKTPALFRRVKAI